MAIVLAGALISVGVYLGLREAKLGAAPLAAPARPRVMAADEVERATLAAQRAHRAAVAEACRDALGGAAGRWRISYTFSADGAQLARGMKVEAGPGAAARCVQQHLPALRIPPPGREARVSVPFELP